MSSDTRTRYVPTYPCWRAVFVCVCVPQRVQGALFNGDSENFRTNTHTLIFDYTRNLGARTRARHSEQCARNLTSNARTRRRALRTLKCNDSAREMEGEKGVEDALRRHTCPRALETFAARD